MGDYALALKGNQGTLYNDVRLFLDDPATPVDQATQMSTQVSKGHGRIETRVATVATTSPGFRKSMTDRVCRLWARLWPVAV